MLLSDIIIAAILKMINLQCMHAVTLLNQLKSEIKHRILLVHLSYYARISFVMPFMLFLYAKQQFDKFTLQQ